MFAFWIFDKKVLHTVMEEFMEGTLNWITLPMYKSKLID